MLVEIMLIEIRDRILQFYLIVLHINWRRPAFAGTIVDG